MVQEEKSEDHNCYFDFSSGDHKHLYNILWQSIQKMLRCFRTNHSGESTTDRETDQTTLTSLGPRC